MATTIRTTFDSTVLRPERQLDLRPDATYVITIEDEIPTEQNGSKDEHPLTKIGRLATDMGVDDLAANHDWYAHGRIPDEPDGR
jgi:hypothetical protein